MMGVKERTEAVRKSEGMIVIKLKREKLGERTNSSVRFRIAHPWG